MSEQKLFLFEIKTELFLTCMRIELIYCFYELLLLAQTYLI